MLLPFPCQCPPAFGDGVPANTTPLPTVTQAQVKKEDPTEPLGDTRGCDHQPAHFSLCHGGQG